MRNKPAARLSSVPAIRWCWFQPAPMKNPKSARRFFPLTVDYREYTYAAGKFPGGFIKREGRPTEKEFSPAG